jgi:hypothetical protein
MGGAGRGVGREEAGGSAHNGAAALRRRGGTDGFKPRGRPCSQMAYTNSSIQVT